MKTCKAHLVGLALIFAATAGAAERISYDGPAVQIPDADEAGVSLTMEVSGLSGTISDLDVSIDSLGQSTAVLGDPNAGIAHPFVSDLRIWLVSPSGAEVVLVDGLVALEGDRNFAGTHFDDEAGDSITEATGEAPFTGRYRPVETLDLFNGEVPNGTWTLRVADQIEDDEGVARAWTLHIETVDSDPPAPPVVEIHEPDYDTTIPNGLRSVGISGTAWDYDGSIATVQVRVIPPETDPRTIPWGLAFNDSGNWTEWSVPPVTMELGENEIQIRASDNDFQYSLIATRTIIRDEPMYNGPTPDMAWLDSNGTVEVSLTRTGSMLNPDEWLAQSDLQYDPASGWKTLAGDFDGDELSDLLAITPEGEAIVRFNTGSNGFGESISFGSGFLEDASTGWAVFSGDLNGDGLDDLVQLSPNEGELFGSLNTGSSFDTPLFQRVTGFRWAPSEGHWVDVADYTGDGYADVTYCTPNGKLFVTASKQGRTFRLPLLWAETDSLRLNIGTPSSPLSATGLVSVDGNGDGRSDIAYLDTEGVVSLCLSDGWRFLAPENWGDTGLIYAPLMGHGWSLFAGDMNADSMEDLVQLDQFGDVGVSFSTGNRFQNVQKLFGETGFRNNLEGPNRSFLGHFGD